MRKLILIGLLACLFLLANAMILAHWLDKTGVIGWANSIRREYITGTAITIMLALLILLVPARQIVTGRRGWLKRCPVCDESLLRPGKYCSNCGSRVP
jgi:hypothetical protein